MRNSTIQIKSNTKWQSGILHVYMVRGGEEGGKSLRFPMEELGYNSRLSQWKLSMRCGTGNGHSRSSSWSPPQKRRVFPDWYLCVFSLFFPNCGKTYIQFTILIRIILLSNALNSPFSISLISAQIFIFSFACFGFRLLFIFQLPKEVAVVYWLELCSSDTKCYEGELSLPLTNYKL